MTTNRTAVEGRDGGEPRRQDLGLVLSYLTGRKLTLDEVLAAVGMSRSTYYDRQGKGTLTTTDTLLRAARNLDLNPVDLLIRYGRIEPTDVADYLEGDERPLARRRRRPPRRRAGLSAPSPSPLHIDCGTHAAPGRAAALTLTRTPRRAGTSTSDCGRRRPVDPSHRRPHLGPEPLPSG